MQRKARAARWARTSNIKSGVTATLTNSGYEVESASDGDEAFRLYRKGNRANKQSVMVAIVSGGISVKGQPSWLNKPLQPTSRLQEGRFTPTTTVPPTRVVTSNPR